jgi:hypothetical protein
MSYPPTQCSTTHEGTPGDHATGHHRPSGSGPVTDDRSPVSGESGPVTLPDGHAMVPGHHPGGWCSETTPARAVEHAERPAQPAGTSRHARSVFLRARSTEGLGRIDYCSASSLSFPQDQLHPRSPLPPMINSSGGAPHPDAIPDAIRSAGTRRPALHCALGTPRRPSRGCGRHSRDWGSRPSSRRLARAHPS